MGLRLSSPAFEPGAMIPVKYTCDGEDVVPPLEWEGVPRDARSLALVMEDPDASNGPFSHWVLYNIPSSVSGVPEGAAAEDVRGWGARVGRNDFGRDDYGGSCPPPGAPHNYNFRLYALDDEVTLPEGATRQQLYQEIQRHIVAEAVLVGRYARER